MSINRKTPNLERLDRVVAEARRNSKGQPLAGKLEKLKENNELCEMA